MIKKEELKDMKKIDFILSEEMKNSNFQMIHDKYQNEKESSFIENQEKIQDLIKERNSEEFQFIMIHRESRKIYYLFIHDIKNDELYFIMKNDSIMKNKIFLLKMIQFFNINEMKINYFKNDRKNQSSEIIDLNSEYKDKLIKYSMI